MIEDSVPGFNVFDGLPFFSLRLQCLGAVARPRVATVRLFLASHHRPLSALLGHFEQIKRRVKAVRAISRGKPLRGGLR
jgi:hypothetical protein